MEYGTIPKRPSQQIIGVQSQSECREQDKREFEGVDESFGKVPDREIVDMDRQMTVLGLRGRTSTVKKLFEDETAISQKRGSRQDASENQVNDFGEDNIQFHTLQDAEVFDQQCNLMFKPKLMSSLGKGTPEADTSSPRLSSGNCQGGESTMKQEFNVFGGIDPKMAFFQGYRLALEEMKKEGIITPTKRNDKSLYEQQGQERVSVATEGFKGQNKKDRNSNHIKQTNYAHSEKFDERELVFEKERLCQRERLLQERQRRQKILEEKKEQIGRAELELIKKEKWLKDQEDKIDESFCKHDIDLEHRAEQIRIRKKDLERRESQLRQTQNAPRNLQIRDIELDAKVEQERIIQEETRNATRQKICSRYMENRNVKPTPGRGNCK